MEKITITKRTYTETEEEILLPAYYKHEGYFFRYYRDKDQSYAPIRVDRVSSTDQQNPALSFNYPLICYQDAPHKGEKISADEYRAALFEAEKLMVQVATKIRENMEVEKLIEA